MRKLQIFQAPQLVVPITNSRYAINAVNARWGSFYDALYGTDAIDDITKIKQYDPLRGAKVISYAKKHLDKIAPLHKVSWNQIIDIRREGKEIKFFLNSNSYTGLVDDKQIAGLIFDSKERIEELILVKNNLHCRVVVNPNSPIGKSDPANISDIILESAISSILDCEDSVSTVDAEDKLLAYRNWLGLMKGNLESEFIKNKQKINRVMNDDIEITTLSGKKKFFKRKISNAY